MVRRFRFSLTLIGLVAFTSCFNENIPGRFCRADADCTETGYPKCDTRFKTCVPSTFDFDMGTGGGVDLTTVGCSMSSTCPASAPVCSSSQICSACPAVGMSTECSMFHPTTPLCGASGGCVECLTKDNCDAKHQTCDTTTNACSPCKANSDCTSGLCNATTGVCADKSTLLYVNNASGAGCSDGGAGTFTTPFCTVQRGLNASSGAARQVIVFVGQGYAEAITATGTADYVASAVGVGGPVLKPTGSQPVLSVSGSATKMVSVSFDGFVFDASSLTGTTDAVTCAGNGAAYGAAVVNLVRSTIKASPGRGLSATAQCTINLDADSIHDNKAGGIRFDTADFALTNLLLLSNGTPTSGTAGSNFGGILVSAVGESGKMNVANLTILGNKADSGVAASAMQCPPAAVKTINTVIFGNSGPSTEVQTTCVGTVALPQMTFSSFAGGSSTLNNLDTSGCAASLLFVDPGSGNYTPKKGNMAPCTLVDQGTNVGAPDHDYYGTPRPQPTVGGKWDIGAIEAL